MIGSNNVPRNPAPTQRGEGMPGNKVTRYDIIKKNYIFPQDEFNIQSNYSVNYYDKSKERVRTEKGTYPVNEILPTGKFQASTSYVQDFVSNEPARRQLVKHEGQLKIGGKFQGQSSYIQSYTNQGSAKRQEKINFIQNKIMPEGNFQAVSTYAQNYQNNPIQYIPKIKPSGELKLAGGALQGQSTYLMEYYNKEVAVRSQKIKFPDNQMWPQGQFQGNSTYCETYLNKQKGKKSELVKHQGELKVGGQFHGQSSYAQNYYDKGLPIRQEKFQLPNNKVIPEGKFQEDTTYSANYIKTIVPRIQKFKPQGQLKLAGGTFQGHSSYGSEYVKKEIELKSDIKKKIYPQNQVIPKGQFTGSSTYTQNYIQTQITANKPFKMEGQLRVGGRFEGNSNYAENYFYKPLSNREEKIYFPQNIVIPQGKFEVVSTYSENYLNNPIQMIKKIKPEGQLKLPGGALDGRSTYETEYNNKQNVHLKDKKKITENEVIPRGQFNRNSTYQDTYLGTQVERNTQVRHQKDLNVVSEKFDGNSSYKNDFQSGLQGRQQLNKKNDYISIKK